MMSLYTPNRHAGSGELPFAVQDLVSDFNELWTASEGAKRFYGATYTFHADALNELYDYCVAREAEENEQTKWVGAVMVGSNRIGTIVTDLKGEDTTESYGAALTAYGADVVFALVPTIRLDQLLCFLLTFRRQHPNTDLHVLFGEIYTEYSYVSEEAE